MSYESNKLKSSLLYNHSSNQSNELHRESILFPSFFFLFKWITSVMSHWVSWPTCHSSRKGEEEWIEMERETFLNSKGREKFPGGRNKRERERKREKRRERERERKGHDGKDASILFQIQRVDNVKMSQNYSAVRVTIQSKKESRQVRRRRQTGKENDKERGWRWKRNKSNVHDISKLYRKKKVLLSS